MTETTTETPSDVAGPHLEINMPGTATRTVKLGDDVVLVGRANDNDIQLLDSRISKRHAEIRREGKQFVLQDAGSRAGVFVNGDRVERQALVEGDLITFGPFDPPSVAVRLAAAESSSVDSAPTPLSELPGGGAQHDLENLSRFLEFSRVYAGGVELSAVLDRVVDVAMEITNAERGSLILVRDGGSLDFEVVRERGRGAVPREGYRVSETIVQEVVARREPRVVSDIALDEDLSAVRSIVALQLGSAVAVPLWRFALGQSDDRAQSTDEVFGVLYMDSRARRDAFSQFDVGMLESLARDASSAIENARLLRDAEEKRRMEREIRTAREVQAALLPENYWSDPHFEIAGSCVPCLDLGGDYLDQFRLRDGRPAFVVADVCGKGLPAALLAAAVQGALASEMDSDHDLGTIIARVNRVVSRLAPLGDFISLLCCVLSPDGELTYVNAGHCPLITVHGDEVQSLVTGGMALGILDDAKYEVRSVQLRRGEVALLYTDGVLEAESPQGELFGSEQLNALLTQEGGDANQVVHRVIDAVERFRGDRPVADDITLMAIRYAGQDEAPRAE